MNNKKIKLVMPFLKWVGGKRQLLSEINKYVPKRIDCYYEPFLGGGAVFFAIQPRKAVVNDFNNELINLYVMIKDNIDELIDDLKKHENTKEYFYHLRGLDRNKEAYSQLTPVQRASRIQYLNKTCYNGLFRVNSMGEFNTPFGSYKNPNIVNELTLRAVHKYLKENEITLMSTDFEEVLKTAKKGDFVYLDPPYDPVSDSASFTGYTSNGFGSEEQKRLKKVCDELNAKKVKFLLSNSATDFIKDLYKDYRIEIVSAKRNINSKGDGRGDVDEVLIRNYV